MFLTLNNGLNIINVAFIADFSLKAETDKKLPTRHHNICEESLTDST
jgi:hypothetical protein